MEEVSGPVVAIALILSAVFVPTIFVFRHHRQALPTICRDGSHLSPHLGL